MPRRFIFGTIEPVISEEAIPSTPDRRAWIDRVAVSTAFLVNGMAAGAWVSKIPAVQEHLSLSSGALGMVLLAIAAGGLLSMAFTGWLSDRVGDVRIVA